VKTVEAQADVLARGYGGLVEGDQQLQTRLSPPPKKVGHVGLDPNVSVVQLEVGAVLGLAGQCEGNFVFQHKLAGVEGALGGGQKICEWQYPQFPSHGCLSGV